jgi:hypothetical protein
MAMTARVRVDIPCDVQQIDAEGRPWAFLDEARDPERIREGAIVVTGDEADPVVARVRSLTSKPAGVKVTLDLLPGEPTEYAEAMHRAHVHAP